MSKKYELIGEIADFDYHGAWGDYCSPRSLKAFLNELKDGEEATIEINSPGGLVIQGVEMANAIKNSKAKITAHVTGIAASMASVIVAACPKRKMEEASFMMIHDPWGATVGNADEMRKEADVLDQMKKVIMAFYRGAFDKSEEEISALMSEETWYTGAECVENGLKCELIKSDMRAAASITTKHFAKMPDAAKAFMNAQPELNDEGKAALAKAKAEAIEAAKASTTVATAEAPKAEATNWEERYKGASKKINELQNKIVELTTKHDEQVKDLTSKLDDAQKALVTSQEEVSKLKGEFDKVQKDLGEMTERAKHLEETRAAITGGVLTPPTEGTSYAAKMKAAKTPEEREALRADRKAGKIK